MRHSMTLPVCAACVLASTATLAEVKRDLDSHVHGAAQLNVIIDSNAMYLEFESPWMNLVGFEHQPSTAEQASAVDSAIALLQNPLELFSPNAQAGCSVEAVSVTNSMAAMGEDHDKEHDHDHDKEHAHDGEHDHDHDKEHAAHDDKHDHDHSDTHSEVVAAYTYRCEDIDDLSELDVAVFQQWPGIEDVDIQMAGPGGQSALELDSGNAMIDLSSIQ